MDPFRAYIGKTVLLRHSLFVIVRSEVHGREIRFILRHSTTGEEATAAVWEILESEAQAA